MSRAIFLSLTVMAIGCNGRFDFGETPDAGTCSEERSCPAPLHCELGQGACVQCLADQDCTGAAKACDLVSHRCVGCVRSTQCGVREICEPKTNRCIPSCGDADDCPLGYLYCFQSKCLKCDESEHCQTPAAPVCDPNIGLCVQCASDLHCQAPTPRCDRSTGTCVGCTSSVDCGGASPYCAPSSQRCTSL